MLFLVFLLTSLITFSQEITSKQRAQLDKFTVQDVPKGAPGVAVGILKSGKVIYTHYAGFANLQDSIRIGKTSRFNIASNGKQFTAFAILTLAEKNKLSLEDDIRKYLPNLYKDIKQPIKIKQLLNHSAGIRDVYSLWNLQGYTWWEQKFGNTDALQLLAQQQELNFLPGTNYSYSNSNYIVLTEIVAKVMGISFVAYTNQLFKDLGMPNTSFVDDYTNIQAPIAKPYFNFETWQTYDWTCNIHGDGNIFTTLEDQLQWEKLLYTKESNVFSKALLAKSQEVIANTNIDNYGFGLEFGTHKGIPYKFHAGGTGAWKAITLRFPEQDFAIVTMINSGKIDPMAQALQFADVLLNKTDEKESFAIVPAKVGAQVSHQDILGIYRTKSGYIMKFEEREGKLYMIREGRNDILLQREAANIFNEVNDPPFKQEFTKNAEGIMQITAYYPTVAPFTLTRIESDLSTFNFKKLNGAYQNSETNTEFAIKHVEADTYEVTMGGEQLKALLIKKDEILVNGYNLRFEKDKQGNIDEIFVSANRMYNVRYVRK